MNRPSTLSSAAASDPVPPLTASQVPLAQGRLASSADVPATTGSGDPAGVTERIAEDRDRIAQGLADVVVHRLFSAGIDLQSALGLIGEHRATSKIRHALDELDEAIRDIRKAVFDS